MKHITHFWCFLNRANCSLFWALFFVKCVLHARIMQGFPNEGSQTCLRVEIVFAHLSASFSAYSFKGTVITCLITKCAACTQVCTDFINNQTMICLKGRLCSVFTSTDRTTSRVWKAISTSLSNRSIALVIDGQTFVDQNGPQWVWHAFGNAIRMCTRSALFTFTFLGTEVYSISPIFCQK